MSPPLSSEDHMGVTGNAVLLLGYVAGALRLAGERSPLYEVVQVEAARGLIVVQHTGAENLYRLSVVQIEGRE
jgi:hypothetical protein